MTCECEGQADLMDLVGSEYIRGSMPADASGRLAAQMAFYQRLRDGRSADDLWQIGERDPE